MTKLGNHIKLGKMYGFLDGHEVTKLGNHIKLGNHFILTGFLDVQKETKRKLLFNKFKTCFSRIKLLRKCLDTDVV